MIAMYLNFYTYLLGINKIDLKHVLSINLQHFILEFGTYFSFIGDEYPIGEVVKHAISRSATPVMIAEYETKLINKCFAINYIKSHKQLATVSRGEITDNLRTNQCSALDRPPTKRHAYAHQE